MSKLETNTIDTVSGTTNLVIGSTNTSTITMPNGALSGQNYPAFHVRISSDFGLTTGTWTTVPFDTEDIDTNSTYNTTNYRFTPAISGKYYLYAHCYFVGGSTGATQYHQVGFVKNGSTNIGENGIDFRNTNGYGGSAHINSIIDFNTTDYVTVRARIVSTGSPYIASTRERTVFGGFRIGA